MRLTGRSTLETGRSGLSGDTPSGDHGPLVGSWAAVRWGYVSVSGQRSIDVVGDLGGTVTLSLAAGTYVLSWDDRNGGPRSAEGTYAVTDDEWLAFRPTEGENERVGFRRAAGTVVLRSETSAFAFDGQQEEPAVFTAVLVRL